MRQKILARWNDRAKSTASLGMVLGLFLMVASFWSVGQNWISYDLSGAPGCSTIGASTVLKMEDGQSVSIETQCNSGWDAVNTSQEQPLGAQNNNDSIPTTLGLPAVTFSIMALLAISSLGLILRNALVFLPGIYLLNQLFTTYNPTQAALQGNLGAEFFSMEFGWSVTTFLVAAAVALFLTGGTLVAVTNHRLRKQIITEVSGKESLGLVSDLRVFARSGIGGGG